MTSDVENLVLEHLRAIRVTLADHGERLDRIELLLSAVEQKLGSLYALSGSDREDRRSGYAIANSTDIERQRPDAPSDPGARPASQRLRARRRQAVACAFSRSCSASAGWMFSAAAS